ncbi:MAG: hypothetical protein HY423_10050 [Candidatus Lambdaproteobacteria bacterium]|nr:hypothetical protein [Candidatus Lambdaproteobacteria bacterium]
MDSGLQIIPAKLVLFFAFTIVLSVFMTGCLAERVEEKTGDTGGNNPPGDTGGNNSSCSSVVWNGFQGTATPNANWEYIQPKIFGGRGFCTNCHTGAIGAGPSDLSWDFNQYGRVVTNRLMSGYPDAGMHIIEPGFKDCSFLYLKITGSDSALVAAGLGSRMPLEKPPLSAADTQLIGEWIDQGAVLAAP